MTRRCREFDESVLDLVYGEIEGRAADALREHAAACPACRETLAGLLLTRRLAARLPPGEIEDTGREAILSAARRAAAGFAEGRARPIPVDEPGLQPFFVHREPGFFDRLRAALLRPAFATAAAASLVLAVALVLYQRGAGPVDDFRVETSAPFLGPIGAGRTAPAQQTGPAALPAVSPPMDPPAEELKAEAVRESAAEDRLALAGRGRGGGGTRRSTADAAEPLPGTSGPHPGEELAAAPGPRTIRDEAPAKRPGADSWPEARGDVDDLEALPRRKSAAAPAGAATASPAAPPAKQAFAAAPPADGFSSADGDATYEEALAAYRRGDCAGAIPLFERLVAAPGTSSGTRASSLHHLALCEKRAGRCSQAIPHFDALLAGYPGYARRPDALWEAAACHRRLGDTSEARRHLVDLARYPAWRERAFEELHVMDQLGGAP